MLRRTIAAQARQLAFPARLDLLHLDLSLAAPNIGCQIGLQCPRRVETGCYSQRWVAECNPCHTVINYAWQLPLCRTCVPYQAVSFLIDVL